MFTRNESVFGFIDFLFNKCSLNSLLLKTKTRNFLSSVYSNKFCLIWFNILQTVPELRIHNSIVPMLQRVTGDELSTCGVLMKKTKQTKQTRTRTKFRSRVADQTNNLSKHWKDYSFWIFCLMNWTEMKWKLPVNAQSSNWLIDFSRNVRVFWGWWNSFECTSTVSGKSKCRSNHSTNFWCCSCCMVPRVELFNGSRTLTKKKT